MPGPWSDSGGPPVVALGGNALIPDPGRPELAAANAAAFARALATLLPEGSGVVLVHGNGPQVGTALLRAEAAAGEVPEEPLDVLVAGTQGSIGYLLSRAIGGAFAALGLETQVVAMVTQVLVDADDPAMSEPSKPVGPFYDAARGEEMARERGWRLVEVPGRGMRRVVPSPRPRGIVELRPIADGAADGVVVIAGGGGGVPVTLAGDGSVVGVEAVIDKDRTAALIATSLDARGLVVLTDVDHVSTGYGTPDERPLRTLTTSEARRLADAGEFPRGSMGPKVESCVAFTVETGRPSLITSVAALPMALDGDAGTWLEAAEAG